MSSPLPKIFPNQKKNGEEKIAPELWPGKPVGSQLEKKREGQQENGTVGGAPLAGYRDDHQTGQGDQNPFQNAYRTETRQAIDKKEDDIV